MSILGVMSAGGSVRGGQKKSRGFCPQGVMSVYHIFRVCVCVCVMSSMSSTMNMVTQIIYLGRMEVGDWCYQLLFF